VLLPHATLLNNPKAPLKWGWQWVFHQHIRWGNMTTVRQGCHHIVPTLTQKVKRRAVLAAEIRKSGTCHCMSNSLPLN